MNSNDLHCPNCDEILIKSGVYTVSNSGELYQGFDFSLILLPELIPSLNDDMKREDCWYIVHDMLLFENMGFTNRAHPSHFPEKFQNNILENYRLLCCASCDAGPLGFSASMNENTDKILFALYGARVRKR